MIALILANVALALAWAAVTGSLTATNLVFGFVLGALALALVRYEVGSLGYFRRLQRTASLSGLFLLELIKSALRVARVVLSPEIRIRPGIIAFPLTATRDGEITLLANMITLTPGTLTMDVSDDRETLYIHCIDVPDPTAVRSEIAMGFERRIIEAFR